MNKNSSYIIKRIVLDYWSSNVIVLPLFYGDWSCDRSTKVIKVL